MQVKDQVTPLSTQTGRMNGTPLTVKDLRSEIIGIDTVVPVLDGSERPYVFLDNGASTPTFRRVMKRIEEFLPWYSGVHRGMGFKSIVATEAYDRAHDVVATFLGADPRTSHVIFTKNTTECANKLAQRFAFSKDDIVVTTGMEHHSNDLPWRKHAEVIHVPVKELGYLDLAALQQILARHEGNVRLVAVTGASNITGICEPIHQIARWAHAAGALIFVDAAQLVPHRPVNVLPDSDSGHIDFLAFSAHKIYAPFGTGVLLGPLSFFEKGEPDAVGGGVASIVTLDSVQWNDASHRDEAGSPNVVGGIALAEALTMMMEVGMENVAAHEQELVAHAYDRLKRIQGIVFYGPTTNTNDKVGVIAFNVEGMHPGLVAAILATEGAIGVRNGYFCAQPYVKRLLNINEDDAKDAGCGVVETDASTFPGMVRASFGCYSNEDDVAALVEMLEHIVKKRYKGVYAQNPSTGIFQPGGFSVDVSRYFSPFASHDQPTTNNTTEAS